MNTRARQCCMRQVAIAASLALPMLLILGSAAVHADHLAFCKRCHRTLIRPGGGGGAGVERITCDTCRHRDKDGNYDPCADAPTQAAQLHQLFARNCHILEEADREIRSLRVQGGNEELVQELLAREGEALFNLQQLQMQWTMLQERCQVAGNLGKCKIFDDANAAERNKPERKDPAPDSGRRAQNYAAAADAAQNLEDVIGFLETIGAKLPAGAGLEVPHRELTRSYRRVADDFRQHAVMQTSPEKLDVPESDYKKVILPKLKPTQTFQEKGDLERFGHLALDARVGANNYLLAYLESERRYMAAAKAKDKSAMADQAQAKLDFLGLATVKGQLAANHRAQYEPHLQKALEEGLAKAAKGAGGLQNAVQQFHTKVKSDLPAAWSDVSKNEIDSCRRRLLGLSAAKIDAVIKARKWDLDVAGKIPAKDKLSGRVPPALDAVILLQLTQAAREAFQPLAPAMKK